VVQLLACVDEPKVIYIYRAHSEFSIIVFQVDTANGGTRVSLNCYRFARKSFKKNLDIPGCNLGSIGSMYLWRLR